MPNRDPVDAPAPASLCREPRRAGGSPALLATVLVWGLAATLALPACAGDDMNWDDTRRMVREAFPEVRQVSVGELRSMLDAPPEQRPLLVDVRDRREYAVSHLPGALHAQGDDLVRLLREEADGRGVVLYCSVGYRSSEAAARLAAEGFGNVANLEGSIFEWANEGLPVVREGAEVREVHPYDRRWGTLLDRDLWAWPEDSAASDG